MKKVLADFVINFKYVMMKKTIEQIDVNEKLSSEDFFTLFENVNLPHDNLKQFYEMYMLFLNSDVSPIGAWVAIRNLFLIKMSSYTNA